MELDDLKPMWDSPEGRPLNSNIMETINSTPKNPLALLQQKLKYNFYLFPVAVIWFAGHLIKGSPPLSTWLLFGILLTEFVFYAYSYGMVKSLQNPEGKTKDNLLHRVGSLQQTMRWQLITNEVLYLTMAIVLEITMYHHWDVNFERWYSVALLWRVIAYAAILLLIFMLKRNSNQKQYGQYISKLSDLLKQAE